ncbi:MAG: hypothetical protein K2W99_02335 [Chthoniobacterales bacterium]|nr:hypothetical protein [Chthoniobacterales bacterium]
MKKLSFLLLLILLVLAPVRVSAMMKAETKNDEDSKSKEAEKAGKYSKEEEERGLINNVGTSYVPSASVKNVLLKSESNESSDGQGKILTSPKKEAVPRSRDLLEEEDLSDLGILEQRIQEAREVVADLPGKGTAVSEQELRNLYQTWLQRYEVYQETQSAFLEQNNSAGPIEQQQNEPRLKRLGELVEMSKEVVQMLEKALENSSKNSMERIHLLIPSKKDLGMAKQHNPKFVQEYEELVKDRLRMAPSERDLQRLRKRLPQVFEQYEELQRKISSLKKELAGLELANNTVNYNTLKALIRTYGKKFLIYDGMIAALKKKDKESLVILYEGINKVSKWYEECAESHIAANEIFKEGELARLAQPKRLLKAEKFIHEFLQNEKADKDAQSRLENAKNLAVVEEKHLYFENYFLFLEKCKLDARNYKNALLLGNPLREEEFFFRRKPGTYIKPTDDNKVLDSCSRDLSNYQSSFDRVISMNSRREMNWNNPESTQFIKDFDSHVIAGSTGYVFAPSNTKKDYSIYTPSIFSLDYYLSTPNAKIMEWVDENRFQQYFKDDLKVMQKTVEIVKRTNELIQTTPSLVAFFRFYRVGIRRNIRHYHAFKREFYDAVLKKEDKGVSNYYLAKAQQAEQKADSLSNFMRDWKGNDDDWANSWLDMYKLTKDTEDVFYYLNSPDLNSYNGGSDFIDSWLKPFYNEEKLQVEKSYQAWQSCQQAMRRQTEAANLLRQEGSEEQKELALLRVSESRRGVQEQLSNIKQRDQEIRRAKDQWYKSIEPIANFGKVPVRNEVEYFERANNRFDYFD